MPNDPKDKARILARVRRIRGQCEALERALQDGVACAQILQQIAAVRGATNGLMAEVIETHIRDEFTGPAGEGAEKTTQLLALMRSYVR